MINKENLEKEFRMELNYLLNKYNAEILLEQRGIPYMEYDVIVVSIDPKYGVNGEMINPSTEFEL